MNADIVGVIPARYASSRLPGKPLLDIGGKPMIQWVVEGVSRASMLTRVLVATDDERVRACVEDFGGEVMMTPEDLPSGTDRVAYVARELDGEIVVNVQGDEPFIEPRAVDTLVALLMEDASASMGTLVCPLRDREDLTNPTVAKVVVDGQGYALYFSRSPIPFLRDSESQDDWISNHGYFKHVSVYGYRKDFLHRYAQHGTTPLEGAEKLEQLRALEMGCRIRVAETDYISFGVDTPEDLEKARLMAEKMNIPGRS